MGWVSPWTPLGNEQTGPLEDSLSPKQGSQKGDTLGSLEATVPSIAMLGSPGGTVTVGGINSSSGSPAFIPGQAVLSAAPPWGRALPQDRAVGASREQRGRRRLCCVRNCSKQQPAIFIGHDQIVNSESSLMQGSGRQQPPAPHPELLLIQGTLGSAWAGKRHLHHSSQILSASSSRRGEAFSPCRWQIISPDSGLLLPCCWFQVQKPPLCLQPAGMAGPGFAWGMWSPGRADGQRAGQADPGGYPQPCQSGACFLLEDVCSGQSHFTG